MKLRGQAAWGIGMTCLLFWVAVAVVGFSVDPEMRMQLIAVGIEVFAFAGVFSILEYATKDKTRHKK